MLPAGKAILSVTENLPVGVGVDRAPMAAGKRATISPARITRTSRRPRSMLTWTRVQRSLSRDRSIRASLAFGLPGTITVPSRPLCQTTHSHVWEPSGVVVGIVPYGVGIGAVTRPIRNRGGRGGWGIAHGGRLAIGAGGGGSAA